MLDSLSSISGKTNQSVVLMGDFNDRCTSWDSDHSESELGRRFVNLIDSLNMFQLIRSPTRNANLLDLLITDSPGYFTDVDIMPPIDNLDHCIIHGTFAVIPPKHHTFTRKVWQYERGNYDLLNNLLLLTDWDSFFSTADDINILTENFTILLVDLAELCVPSKTVKVRSRDKPGMNSEVRRLFKIAKKLNKRAKKIRKSHSVRTIP